jgi:tRNA threonylcarbamoyl adenosine modification protein (Sua5/YciO/YrdC/YwlC family)
MNQTLNALSDKALIEALLAGKVGVVPTDTTYGLVCRAADDTAVKKLYALKSRESKPGTVIAAALDQLIEMGLKARYLKAVEAFWPNAISVVIPAGPELSFLHQGKYGLACRVVKEPPALIALLKKTGPLLTTSANLPDKKPAATVDEAKAYFGDNVDFYVNGGDFSGHLPSTVIRIVDDAVEILRPGAVQIDEETGKILS